MLTGNYRCNADLELTVQHTISFR